MLSPTSWLGPATLAFITAISAGLHVQQPRPADLTLAHETTVLEIRLRSPEGPWLTPPETVQGQVSAPPLMQMPEVYVTYLDTGLSPFCQIGNGPKVEWHPDTNLATASLVRNRLIGVVAIVEGRGFVEHVITPEMTCDQATLAIDLALPAQSLPGTVEAQLHFSVPRTRDRVDNLLFLAPITGVLIRRVSVREDDSTVRVDLPPGTYRAALSPQEPPGAGCDFDPWLETPLGVELYRDVTVRPGRSTHVRHTFREAEGLSFRIDVLGREAEVEADPSRIKALTFRARVGAHYDRAMPPTGDGWHATARLASKDPGSTWSERPLRVFWDRNKQFFGVAAVPLGLSVTTVDRVPPGSYRLTLEGPRIQTTTVELTVPAPQPAGGGVAQEHVIGVLPMH